MIGFTVTKVAGDLLFYLKQYDSHLLLTF